MLIDGIGALKRKVAKRRSLNPSNKHITQTFTELQLRPAFIVR